MGEASSEAATSAHSAYGCSAPGYLLAKPQTRSAVRVIRASPTTCETGTARGSVAIRVPLSVCVKSRAAAAGSEALSQ